jgi:hypothetical protein
LNVQPDIYPQKGIFQLLLKASLASLQPVQQPTGENKIEQNQEEAVLVLKKISNTRLSVCLCILEENRQKTGSTGM